MKLFILLALILSVLPVVSAPPSPHNVVGFIFHVNGSGLDNGAPVIINDTTLGSSTVTAVSAPPIPQFAGAYSGTIVGDDGDSINVTSWNATHWGESTGILASTTRINVTINLTRAPEPNVTIVSPPDNSIFNASVIFTVTANVTVLGADGTCNATISFGNGSVLAVTPGQNSTVLLGTVQRDTTASANFSVEGVGLGFSSVAVSAECSPVGRFLEAVSVDTLQNITIVDESPPTIELIFPLNNTLNKTSSTINFTYNVTDFSAVDNCSLVLNNIRNETDTTIVKNTDQSFAVNLPNGQYNWSVNCTDELGNEGNSVTHNLTVEVFPPGVNISIDTVTILAAGNTRRVVCNVSSTDQDGEANILSANATFYFSMNATEDNDDPNEHYTNSSCSVAGAFGDQKNFTCSFEVQYFAVNGSWFCNATVVDLEGLTGFDDQNNLVDPLYAINVTDTLMYFGDLSGNSFSADILQNISNIGNQPINVTVYGYGLNPGDGNAFGCGIDNVSVGLMKFASNSSASYVDKESLDGSPKQLRMSIPKQTQLNILRQNTSYWQVFIPNNISDQGLCNGTIVFHSELS